MKLDEVKKREVRNTIKKWRTILFLQEWNFDIEYIDEESGVTEIIMNTEYKEAVIKIRNLYWNEDKDRREMILVHELCHCIIQPLVHLVGECTNDRHVSENEMNWFKESVTQHIANSIFCK